ncbi:hypothetical protein Tco_1369120 [Tanacetum coccineum]
MTPLHRVATVEAMTEATTPRRRLVSRHWEWIHALQDHMDELPLERLETIQQHIDGSYTVAEATQQDMGALQDALVLARGQISNLEFCLDESKAKEAAFKTCMRALE